MRSNVFKVLAFCLPILTGAVTASAQTTNVVDWDHVWRYSDTGAQPAPNWFATNYNDSGWAFGPGAFGFPADENLLGHTTVSTPLAVNDGSGVQIITYYFRTTFVLPRTNDLSLTFSNLVDDGAVIYLNGREVRRLAMVAPPTAITYSSIATRQDDISAHGMEGTLVNLTNVVVGTNYLAVEVHQGEVSGSSDAIMGMKVVANFAEAPRITEQPENLEIDLGERPTFTVTATGTLPLTYRWYSNNVLVASSSSTPTHTGPILNDFSANGAIYYVTVSNRLGIATSSNAVLRVIERPPILVSAYPTNLNRITLIFHESLAAVPANTNRTNFAIIRLGTTNRVVITNVTTLGTSGTQPRVRFLHLTNTVTLDPTAHYVVCAYNIADLRTNITKETCIGLDLHMRTRLFGFAEAWRFSDYNVPPSNSPPSVDWKQLNYNDNPFGSPPNLDWKDGFFAPFADEQGLTGNQLCDNPNPDPTGLRLSLPTYYFRKAFTVSQRYGSESSLILRSSLDDGAVFYLNGTEIARVNMPAGTPTHTTRAQNCTEASQTTCSQPLILPGLGSLLRQGNNVLAVEVHNCSETGSGVDAVFDAELSVAVLPVIPEIVATRPTATTLRLSWPTNAPGWVLESAPMLDGPWTLATPVLGSAGTQRHDTAISPQMPMRFFRVRNPTP